MAWLHVILIALLAREFTCSQFLKQREQHALNGLTSHQVRYISALSDKGHLEDAVDQIAIPRVVGTPNHAKIQRYIQGELRSYGFDIENETFSERTPTHGILRFNNIVGTLNPDAERFLVLACHYDSKYFNDIEFVGAIDSAVPCAMMLNLIRTMQQELAAIRQNDVSLKLIFFDGEEAFRDWSKTDSIYGARNLARQWSQKLDTRQSGKRASMLERIDVLVLLDLLGAANPRFYSFFRNTDRHFLALSSAENALAELGLLEGHKKKYFIEQAGRGGIEDDHIPFLQRGVPILHMIAVPFPDTWHTSADNRANVDIATVENLNKILRVFVAAYLHVPLQNIDPNLMLHEDPDHAEL